MRTDRKTNTDHVQRCYTNIHEGERRTERISTIAENMGNESSVRGSQIRKSRIRRNVLYNNDYLNSDLSHIEKNDQLYYF